MPACRGARLGPVAAPSVEVQQRRDLARRKSRRGAAPAAGRPCSRRSSTPHPTGHGPPSSTKSTSVPRSARTCSAVVGLTRPKRLADGAARPPPNRSSSSSVSGWAGTRTPTVSRPPVTTSEHVSGPRHQQRQRPRPARVGEHRSGRRASSPPSRRAVSAVGDVDDQRMVGRPALDGEDPLAPRRRWKRLRPGRTRSRWGWPPARRRQARPSARDRDRRVTLGTASRNSRAASMNANDSGVAKWSTLRKVRSVALGSASASGRPARRSRGRRSRPASGR